MDNILNFVEELITDAESSIKEIYSFTPPQNYAERLMFYRGVITGLKTVKEKLNEQPTP